MIDLCAGPFGDHLDPVENRSTWHLRILVSLRLEYADCHAVPLAPSSLLALPCFLSRLVYTFECSYET